MTRRNADFLVGTQSATAATTACGTSRPTRSHGGTAWGTQTRTSPCPHPTPTCPESRRRGIGVGTLDLFHDENVTYANRLTEAGVPCHVEIVPGAFHAFDRFAPKAAISQAFFNSQCKALRDVFA
jgi:hypothetical protein